MTRTRRRAPYAPLAPFFRGSTNYEIAERLEVAQATVATWRKTGSLELTTADRVATKLGLHVTNIWPDYHQLYTQPITNQEPTQ